MELDSAYRTGILDPTILERINTAKLDGAFGPRGKGGEKTYEDMKRRFDNIKLDSRISAVSEIVSQFKKENADEPGLIFLFNQEKNHWFQDNPEEEDRDAFIKINELKSKYEIMPLDEVDKLLNVPKQKPTEKPAEKKGPIGLLPGEPEDLAEFEIMVRELNAIDTHIAREYYETFAWKFK